MRTLFITGTSRGIGKAIAEAACVDEGFRVHGFSRNPGPVHGSYTHHKLDLSQPESLDQFSFPDPGSGIAEQLILINNAAMLGTVGHLGTLDPEEIRSTCQVNLLSPIQLVNIFVRQFKDYPAPKLIVNLSSGAASNPYDGWSLYCSTKAGLDMVSRVLELEQAIDQLPWPFTVKSVAPGVVDTSMQEQLRQTNTDQFSKKEKFMDLYEEGLLSDPAIVAQRYLELIRSPENWPELISRIPAE